MDFNEKQKEFINQLDENMLLMATAGTGKSTTLANRMVNIIKNKRCLPEEIICLTFTNRSCKDIKNKVMEVVGKDALKITVKTFHSFCFDVVRSEAKANLDLHADFIIFDEEDSLELVKEINDLKISTGSLKKFIDFVKMERTINRIYTGNVLTDYKDTIQLLHRNNKLASVFDKDAIQFYHDLKINGELYIFEYNQLLENNHALDFNDLIIYTVELFKNPKIASKWNQRFKYINIDEFQDTSLLEYSILKELFYYNNVVMCGDIFQTIYEWRGSDPNSIISDFKKDFEAKEICFDWNYRSTETLFNCAFNCLVNLFSNQVFNYYREGAKVFSKNKGNKVIYLKSTSCDEEAIKMLNVLKKLNEADLTKICILTRTNKYNNSLHSSLMKYNEEEQLKFMLIDEFKFFRRLEIKDVLAFIKLIVNKYDNHSFKRIILKFIDHIGDKTLEKMVAEGKEVNAHLSDFIHQSTYQTLDVYGVLLDELKKENVVILDVESTGTDVLSDEIIQIAAIKIDRDGRVIDQLIKFIKPNKKVGNSVYVHNYSDDYLQTYGENGTKVMLQFLSFIDNSVVVGHNVNYDLSIIKSQLSRMNLPTLTIKGYYDTLEIARRFYPDLKSHKLADLCQFFNTKHKPTHDALADILATSELLMRMIDEHIKVNQSKRQHYYNKYIYYFSSFYNYYEELSELCNDKRPHQLIQKIIEDYQLKAKYQAKGEFNRVENLKDLTLIAEEYDDYSKSCYESLMDLLKLTSLSNSELDTMIAKNPKIPIITVHQAKGLEFDHVFIAGLDDKRFPNYRLTEEEKRLFYVAITRAKQNLILSSSTSKESVFMNYLSKNYIEQLS